MRPIHFGSAVARLYGVHHLPTVRRPRDVGVVLCYPAMQEYNRSHWAFRRLAGQLAGMGFHVLRFDYFGTGDSAGLPQQASVAQWCADIATAARELRELAEVRWISLVGFRLGAALAAMATVTEPDVRDLVLWEPAVDGERHVRDLRRIQQRKREMSVNPPRIGRRELLGYDFPAALRTSVTSIHLEDICCCRADRVLLFAAHRRREYTRLARRLGDGAHRSVQCHTIREQAEDRLDGVLLSSRIQHAITAAIAGPDA